MEEDGQIIRILPLWGFLLEVEAWNWNHQHVKNRFWISQSRLFCYCWFSPW